MSFLRVFLLTCGAIRATSACTAVGADALQRFRKEGRRDKHAEREQAPKRVCKDTSASGLYGARQYRRRPLRRAGPHAAHFNLEENMADLHIRDEAKELRLLFEVSQVLEGASALSEQLDTALALMAQYTGMMRGTLLLADPASRDIVVEAAYGLSSTEMKRARYKSAKGSPGGSLRPGNPWWCPRCRRSRSF